MYLSHFGLRSYPFGKALRSDELLDAETQAEARARIDNLVEMRGIGLPAGEPGVGKTAVCRQAVDALHEGLHRVRYVSFSTGSARDTHNAVAAAFGLPESQSRAALGISGARFFDHLAGRGGSAIDLVIHAEGCGFIQALRRLEGLAPRGPRGGDGPSDFLEGRAWAQVRCYLLRSRALDPRLIECCRRIGILGADARANEVFACRGRDGGKTGAELVGTRPGRPFKAMAPGSRKAEGG